MRDVCHIIKEMNAIEIKDLKKYYGKIKAVDGVSLEVKEGEIFGFLGPNGAGKTTTIRCLLNFIHPSSGSISILGLDSQSASVTIKKELGYLSGEVKIYEDLKGLDHFQLMEGIRSGASSALDLAKRFNFNPQIKTKNLSSGNRQKLGLILALMFNPKVLVLDEPTLGLDPLLRDELYEVLKDFKKKGSAIFMSSHYLHEVELVCDRVGIIKDGKMIKIESINRLKELALYKVRVHFDGNFLVDEFSAIGKVMGIEDHILNLQIKGDINPLLKKISQHSIHDLEIERASLEEIFMEYYKEDQRSNIKDQKSN